jgi:hypothetical protein
MAIEKFYIEAGHIMMFARSIGDPNPVFDPTRTDPAEMAAPPTFAQASAQFDPDYFLRPKVGADGWFGSGKEPTSARRSGGGDSGAGGGGGGGGLHAEQHFEIHRPLRPGDVLTATTAPGTSWEKEGKRGGKLLFSESVTEYRDQTGELVVTARGIGVRTEKVVEKS